MRVCKHCGTNVLWCEPRDDFAAGWYSFQRITNVCLSADAANGFARSGHEV